MGRQPMSRSVGSPAGVALRIRLLGNFEVEVGDRAILDSDWRLQKARALVKLLALAPRHRLRREEVMERLWPELEPEAALNNLYYALHVARAALDRDLPITAGSSSMLQLTDGVVAVPPIVSVIVDVEVFQAAALAARQSRTASAYVLALDLYVGELLPEDQYADWAARPRERLRASQLQLLSELALVHEDRGEYADAIDALRRLTAQEPTHEEACTSLMRLHIAAGQRWNALREYAQLRTALREELELEPSAATRALYAAIIADEGQPRTAQRLSA